MNLSWGSPFWLLALLALPPLQIWLRRQEWAALPLPAAGRFPRVSRRAAWIARLPGMLRLLALASLILALARPRTPGIETDDPSAGVPVVIAMDLSSSMLAEDFGSQARVEVARQTVAEFVAARERDPVGIVAFAGEALTVAPVTSYRPVVQNAVRGLEVGLLPDGTAIGDGLAIAVDRLRELPARDRVVILMSDGENNRGAIDPLDAAAAAAALGVRVYTIGVGSYGLARVPLWRVDGQMVYGDLPVSLDEGLLRQIAAMTNGAYFRASDAATLRDIYAQINRLATTPLAERRRVLYREWYLSLLMLAGLALAAEWLLRGSRWGAVPG